VKDPRRRIPDLDAANVCVRLRHERTPF
jgi:hypothetical protein